MLVPANRRCIDINKMYKIVPNFTDFTKLVNKTMRALSYSYIGTRSCSFQALLKVGFWFYRKRLTKTLDKHF